MVDYEDIARRILTGSNYISGMGMSLQSAEADHFVLRVEIPEATKNGYGFMHGGYLFTVADTVAGMTAISDGSLYVTEDSHFQFIGNVKEGTLIADGRALHRGNTITTVLVDISTDDGKLLCHGTFNMFKIPSTTPHA